VSPRGSAIRSIEEAGALRLPAELELTNLGPVRVLEPFAAGKMTVVYRGTLEGRAVALKVYKPAYVKKHSERHPVSLAEYEFTRNMAFWESPELSRYVVRPLGYLDTPGVSAIVQDLIDGELYYDLCLRRGGPLPGVFRHLERIVEYAHARELFDIDLHAMNVLVVREGGEEVPRLFDFNRVPFYLNPRNPLEALALRLGIINERSRDFKKLRQFHNFSKLLRRRSRFMAVDGGLDG